MKFILFLASILAASLAAPSDEKGMADGGATISVTAFSTLNEMPFWQSSRKNGLVPEAGNSLLAVAGGDFGWTAGGEMTIRGGVKGAASIGMARGSSFEKSLLLDRLYLGLDWQKLHLDLGMTDIGENILSDISLTGGNMIWSGNSRNIPGYNIRTDYIELGRRFSIKGNFADYKMLDNRYVPNALVHNQSLFLGFDITQRIKLSIGLEMWCQWSGDGMHEPSLANYLRVVLAKQGGDDASESDQINAIGNHLGRENLRLEWDAERFNMTFNYDKPYEDGSGTRLQNLPDGIYSLLFSFKERRGLVTDIIGEYVTTMCQSGEYHDRPVEEGEEGPWWAPDKVILGGGDNYFNNGEYRSGWTYYGRTIGLPLFTPKAADENGIVLGVSNNRLRAVNIGVKGMVAKKIPYAMKATYSVNYGLYRTPLDPPLKKIALALESSLPKFKLVPATFALGLYADFSNLPTNSFGLSLSLRY